MSAATGGGISSAPPTAGPAAWPHDWREQRWAAIGGPWDVLIVGGGITGAGILRAAAREGLRALLVERDDFASGTSSRSSKLVHGGLRYLASGQPRVTYESVRERERLLRELPGLVERIGFLMPTYRGDHPGRLAYALGLTLYDLLAGDRTRHRHYDRAAFELLAPHLATEGLRGGYRYDDARTDDARLTLRTVLEAVAGGGAAVNRVAAEGLLRDARGEVVGVDLRDLTTERTAEARAGIVVNATGAWADRLRGEVGAAPRIRPLRGSHLVFPAWRLPVAQAISFLHPEDRRPVFVIPWEGATVYGTTDVDSPLDAEPAVSADEAGYLMAGLEARFPSLDLRLDDALSSIAGVRPVIGSGKADPSRESRDHVVWQERGLLTVTGGKLTTFELIARDALRAIERWLRAARSPAGPGATVAREQSGAPGEPPAAAGELGGLDPVARQRLVGRYGGAATDLVAAAAPDELEAVPGTPTLWAELRWAARAEGVVHLDDLLLRRVRLGLLLPEGGRAELTRVRAIAGPELGWDDARWVAEEAAYTALWRRQHGLPGAAAATAAERDRP